MKKYIFVYLSWMFSLSASNEDFVHSFFFLNEHARRCFDIMPSEGVTANVSSITLDRNNGFCIRFRYKNEAFNPSIKIQIREPQVYSLTGYVDEYTIPRFRRITVYKYVGRTAIPLTVDGFNEYIKSRVEANLNLSYDESSHDLTDIEFETDLDCVESD